MLRHPSTPGDRHTPASTCHNTGRRRSHAGSSIARIILQQHRRSHISAHTSVQGRKCHRRINTLRHTPSDARNCVRQERHAPRMRHSGGLPSVWALFGILSQVGGFGITAVGTVQHGQGNRSYGRHRSESTLILSPLIPMLYVSPPTPSSLMESA